MIQDTSLDAYRDTKDERDYLRERIYDLVCHVVQPSSSDIARIGRMQRTSVTGRLRELEQEGRIYKAGKKKDEKTGKTVWWYAPKYKVVMG